jgi:hypothetical protein
VADQVLPEDIRREVVAPMTRQFHSMLLKSGPSAGSRGNAAAAARVRLWSRRPHTGEARADWLRGRMATSQVGGLTDEHVEALTARSASSLGAASTPW